VLRLRDLNLLDNIRKSSWIAKKQKTGQLANYQDAANTQCNERLGFKFFDAAIALSADTC